MKKYLFLFCLISMTALMTFGASITSPSGASGSGSGDMLGANNLNDVSDKPTSRTNLELGTASNVKFASVSANIFSVANTVAYLVTGNTTITVNSLYIQVSANSSIILTTNTTLTAGNRGQLLYIENNGINNIEFQDRTVFVSSNLDLNGWSGILQVGAVSAWIYNTDHWDLVSMPSDVAVQNSQVLDVRNASGASIGIGLPVHVDGYSVGQARPTVVLADADGTNTMPASGVVIATIANNTNGQILLNGTLSGIDTSAWSVEDSLYVSNTAGVFTNVKPANDKVQSMARVIRSHATAGVIIVQGAGRSNDTPHSAVMNGTATINEIVATGGITLGGVRNTAWPSAGSGGTVTQSVQFAMSGAVAATATVNMLRDYALTGYTHTTGTGTLVEFAVWVGSLDTGASQPAFHLLQNGVAVSTVNISTIGWNTTTNFTSAVIVNGNVKELGTDAGGTNNDLKNVTSRVTWTQP